MPTTIKTIVLCAALAGLAAAQPYPPRPFIAMGDSIGEGVQSADSNSFTQPNSYLKLLADRMGVAFPLPLINTTLLSTVESTAGRTRVFPDVMSPNLAVSGADTTSALIESADTVIDREVDLVLAPRLSTQIDIAVNTPSQLMVYWLGNNDALSSLLDFNHLDASQLTPVPVFYQNVDTALSRLKAAGKSRVVLANLITIPQIAYTFDARELADFAGSDFGLAPGSRTSLVAALLLRLGIAPSGLMQNPDWVLDAGELDTINQRILDFNGVLAERAAFYGFPLVDIHAAFDDFLAHPPIIAGVPVTRRFNGGIFSLDGVHPSNTGHALLANLFIPVINRTYHTNIPEFSPAELDAIGAADPFLDLNGNGIVRGRFGRGLVETVSPLVGLSGDAETVASPPAPLAPGAGVAMLAEYNRLAGTAEPRGTPFEQAVRIFKQIYGQRR